MKAPVPNVPVKQDGNLFYPDTEEMMGGGGYARSGFKQKVSAELYTKNLEWAWELGWRAREARFREDLGLDES